MLGLGIVEALGKDLGAIRDCRTLLAEVQAFVHGRRVAGRVSADVSLQIEHLIEVSLPHVRTEPVSRNDTARRQGERRWGEADE